MLVIRMAQESITPLVELPVKVLVGFEHLKNKSGPEPKHLKNGGPSARLLEINA